MICVLASIRVKEGTREAFLEIFNENVAKVRGEAGCIEFFPTLDVDAAIPVQVRDEQVVTIIEKWQSVEALHAHLASPHMLEYREQVRDLVEEVTLKVLQPV